MTLRGPRGAAGRAGQIPIGDPPAISPAGCGRVGPKPSPPRTHSYTTDSLTCTAWHKARRKTHGVARVAHDKWYRVGASRHATSVLHTADHGASRGEQDQERVAASRTKTPKARSEAQVVRIVLGGQLQASPPGRTESCAVGDQDQEHQEDRAQPDRGRAARGQHPSEKYWGAWPGCLVMS